MIGMTDGVKLTLVVVIVMTVAALSFGAGFKVAQWRGDADKLQEARDSANALSDRIDKAVAASNEETQRAIASNQKNLDAMAALSLKLENQTHAFQRIQLDLKGMDVGHCTFTPASDVLYQRAYEAAFGATDHGPAAGEAARGDAGLAATAKTLPDKPPVPE